MAKQVIRGLSADAAAKLPEVMRRVLGDGGSTAITPYGDGSCTLWFVPSASGWLDEAKGRYSYSGKLYATPDATDPISETGVAGLNTYEARNTTTVRAGYTIDPEATACEAIIGVERAPYDVPYLVVGRQKVGANWYVLFAHPSDPTIRGQA